MNFLPASIEVFIHHADNLWPFLLGGLMIVLIFFLGELYYELQYRFGRDSE